jgi:hypothetical protein
MSAKPLGPIKTAMALDVKSPATILVKTAAVFKDIILTKTLVFI